MNSASLFRGCFWTDFSMNNPHFPNLWFFENVILTKVKLMILHNQQAVPRLQIHRFVHEYLRNFCIECSCFSCFFGIDFGIYFLSHFWWTIAPKRPPKSIPGATSPAKKTIWGEYFFPVGASCNQPFFEHRSRLPAAIVPPPGLGKIICMRKICKKFDARSMQVYFLQNTTWKD